MAIAALTSKPAGINRRTFIAAAPAALVAPVAVSAGEETPVIRAFREWSRANTVANATSDDDFDAADDLRWEIEKRIVSIPATDARDVLAKLAAWTDFGRLDVDAECVWLEPLWAEARALIG